ncbi:hypothetical protein MCOR27_002332 [Pyricularia oryzae]|uniref:NUDE domain-containing protein n=1 Tax=Pyricularia grisea TaxID=148305 RepID=A0ABQ8NX08_PYRGI|nr:hypothetical protein MCOR01_000375 [Pyricularia oryzae]KAI6303364.1 hypothetical protein MCOR33_001453 [Pyricularia grisea]KAH9427899.1 hypothetical protein MCOR02_011399 [Pyricularia oryzae]KAI6262046.1 hypothetical protein MCOR19_001713 [Pyricularia oryzae]KAI6282866.1 hypothetical protein MCOR26_002619 [Pyricularia oryzae]
MAEPPSSPPSADATAEDALAWYKSQYEQLELEMQEFQESSKLLESELENELSAADKREREHKEKVEMLGYQVDEWKTKYREAKSEANAAQNTLEKEVTSLRDTNRSLQLKLRDIEVANDDYARQARNTTSSLDDLESKYNVAIERGVLLEEEIKIGEQERETLRIECQRLKDELSDLKIEVDILQGKLKDQDLRHLSALSTEMSVPDSPSYDHSPSSTASSPLITTPPDSKSVATADTLSEIQDPPSPPMSDASAPLPKPKQNPLKTPGPSMQRKSRLPSADNSVTPKPRQSLAATSRAPGSRVATTSSVRTPAPRPTRTSVARAASHRIPPSTSLSHIRSLTEKMQKLEARVQSARSKLPAPIHTPPRASPRSSIVVPSTVTIRSRKRTIGGSSTTSSAAEEATPTNHRQSLTGNSNYSASTSRSHVPRLSTSGVSRLSFGPLPNRNPLDSESSRPSSRASVSSYVPRPASRTDHSRESMPPPRPVSRTSMSGTRTPLGVRPRSSLGGSVHSSSVCEGSESEDAFDPELRTPSRRGTYSKFDMDGSASTSAIPMPSSARRQSGGPVLAGRRSSGVGLRSSGGDGRSSALGDVDETY